MCGSAKNVLNLLGDVSQMRQVSVMRTFGSKQQKCCLFSCICLHPTLCLYERGQGGCVRRYDVVRAGLSIQPFVNARRMDRNKCERSCRTPV
jgi:uncharacterized membrane protein YoaT (DUF817 family)